MSLIGKLGKTRLGSWLRKGVKLPVAGPALRAAWRLARRAEAGLVRFAPANRRHDSAQKATLRAFERRTEDREAHR